jgi:hypothetical protein
VVAAGVGIGGVVCCTAMAGFEAGSSLFKNEQNVDFWEFEGLVDGNAWIVLS